MAGTAITVEWYVARDGKPHGPLSETEMRKFVELGHLRPSDLVWRTGFIDWQPGSVAFPQLAEPKSDAPAAPAVVVDEPRRPQPQRHAHPQSRPEPEFATADSAAGLAVATTAIANLGAQIAEQAHTPAARQPAQQPGVQPSIVGAEAPLGRQRPSLAARDVARPAPDQPAPVADKKKPVIDTKKWDVDDEETPAPRRRRGRALAVTLVLLFIVAGLGWIGWTHFDRLKSGDLLSEIVSRVPGAAASDATTGGVVFPPFVAQGDTAETIDASFQKQAVWRVLKAEYAEWYNERIRDIQRMRFEKRDDAFVTRYLAEAVTTLRRKNADLALASSRPAVRKIATSFLESLDALSQLSPTACFEYISQGEVTLAGLDTLSTRQITALQTQMLSTFEAISDGRKAPQNHQTGRRADYDHLAGMLVKVGWTQSDLQIFSDPRLLARAEPPKVCTMVKDWFRTQLAIDDVDMQNRLLVDSVRPLVAG